MLIAPGGEIDTIKGGFTGENALDTLRRQAVGGKYGELALGLNQPPPAAGAGAPPLVAPPKPKQPRADQVLMALQQHLAQRQTAGALRF
jgi:hypothetical protein